MEIERNLQLTLLFDFYGELLTKRQQQIFKSYLYNDSSLGEIAEELNISRQAVLDCLKKAEKQLFDLESKLGMLNKFNKTKQILKNDNSVLAKKIMQVWEGN